MITRQDVEHIVQLARLQLTKDEIGVFTKQLGSILNYVEKLNELDTADVEPTSHILPMKNVMREDDVRPSLPREDAIRNAPDMADGFYRVPRIIE